MRKTKAKEVRGRREDSQYLLDEEWIRMLLMLDGNRSFVNQPQLSLQVQVFPEPRTFTRGSAA